MLFIKSLILTAALFSANAAVSTAGETVKETCYSATVDMEIGGETFSTTVEACDEDPKVAMAQFREAMLETQQ